MRGVSLRLDAEERDRLLRAAARGERRAGGHRRDGDDARGGRGVRERPLPAVDRAQPLGALLDLGGHRLARRRRAAPGAPTSSGGRSTMCGWVPRVRSIRSSCRPVMSATRKTMTAAPTATPARISTVWKRPSRRKRSAAISSKGIYRLHPHLVAVRDPRLGRRDDPVARREAREDLDPARAPRADADRDPRRAAAADREHPRERPPGRGPRPPAARARRPLRATSTSTETVISGSR